MSDAPVAVTMATTPEGQERDRSGEEGMEVDSKGNDDLEQVRLMLFAVQ